MFEVIVLQEDTVFFLYAEPFIHSEGLIDNIVHFLIYCIGSFAMCVTANVVNSVMHC